MLTAAKKAKCSESHRWFLLIGFLLFLGRWLGKNHDHRPRQVPTDYAGQKENPRELYPRPSRRRSGDDDDAAYAAAPPVAAALQLMPRNKQRILLVTCGIEPFVYTGGISKMFTRYAMTLASLGHTVDVLYPYRDTKNRLHLGKRHWEPFNVSVHMLSQVLHKSYPNFVPQLQQSYNIMRWIVAQNQAYDSIIFHDYYGLALHTLQLKESGEKALALTRLVVTCHSSSLVSDLYNARTPDKSSLYGYGMEDYTRAHADVAIFPSDFYRQKAASNSLTQEPYLNAVVVPNFATSAELASIAPRHSTSDRMAPMISNTFAYYGRIDTLKGAEVIMDALLRINLPIKSFHWVGDFNEQANRGLSAQLNEFEKAMGERNIRVIRHGFLSTAPAIALLRRISAVVILGSLYENFPCAFQELVYAGIPVVYPNAGGTPEVVRESDQHQMYQSGSAASLASLLEKKKELGFAYLQLRHDVSESMAQFERTVLRKLVPAEKRPFTGAPNCSDVTICISTLRRAMLLKRLVENYLPMQTCSSFKVLIKNNNPGTVPIPLSTHLPFTVNQLTEGTHSVAESRQILLKAAATKYVLFFDDDDVPYPIMVEKLRDTAERAKSDLASSSCQNYDKDGNYVHTSLTTGFVGLAPEYAEHLVGKAAVIVRREFALQHGGIPSSETFSGRIPYQDYLMYVSFLAQGAKLANYPIPLYKYTQQSDQSLFYEATVNAKMFGRWDIQTHLCKHLNLAENICQILRQSFKK